MCIMGYTYKRKLEKKLSLMDKKLDDLLKAFEEFKTDQQKIELLSETLSSNTDSLQKAVTDNTPK